MVVLLNTLFNLLRLVRNAYARALRRPPDFVWLPLSGALPEFEPPRGGLIRRRLAPRATGASSLEEIRSRLRRVLADGRPRGVILRVENLGAGWAALEELRAELERFRQRGKKVAAYLVDGDTRSYYLASAADEVYAPPLSTLGIVGLRARVNFLKDSLDRLGLRTEVLAVSPYKSAGDTFARSDFSREAREQAERLLDQRFEELLAAVSAGRNIPRDEVRRLIDRAPYTAVEAVKEGLLDAALYEDELAGALGGGDGLAKIAEWQEAKKALHLPYRGRGARKVVGLVGVEGTITRGRSRRLPVPLPLVGGQQAGSDSVVAALRVAEKSRRVGAVLLHVDSRGGDALASDLIWREVERVRKKKPVVVLMGEAAASGGYYVSAAADHVFAHIGTITGSIGVILTRPVAAGLLDKLGVNPVAIERGARSNLFDPRKRPTPDELSVLEGQLRSFYDGFKDRVASGRGLPPERVEGIAGGRVWTGREALERGLVDEIGTFRDALSKARELAGIPAGAPDDALVKIPPPGKTRPVPGRPVEEAVREAVDGARRTASELSDAPRVWALAPYDISDGW